MINRIERPLANDHPDGSFSVHLFLHRPKTQNLRIIGQYTHNLLGLKTLSFALLLSSTKIWIKGPQIGSDMPSALGLVQLVPHDIFYVCLYSLYAAPPKTTETHLCLLLVLNLRTTSLYGNSYPSELSYLTKCRDPNSK